jgi:predicted LPLAT superfamily acyltransferase
MPTAASIRVRVAELEPVKAFVSAAVLALREHRRTCATAFLSRPDPFNLGPGWVTVSKGRPCQLCEALRVGEENGLVPSSRA